MVWVGQEQGEVWEEEKGVVWEEELGEGGEVVGSPTNITTCTVNYNTQ